MNGLDSQYTFGDVKSGHVFREGIVFDEHGHEVAARKEFHDKIKVLWILKRVEQLNDPSGIRFSKNVAFCSHMSQLCRGELVFAIIILYSVPDPSLTSPLSSKFSWHKFSLYLSFVQVAPLNSSQFDRHFQRGYVYLSEGALPDNFHCSEIV
jgi:hypothetical protein